MIYNKDVDSNQELSDGVVITSQHTDDDRKYVCESLIAHNVKNTSFSKEKTMIIIGEGRYG